MSKARKGVPARRWIGPVVRALTAVITTVGFVLGVILKGMWNGSPGGPVAPPAVDVDPRNRDYRP